MIRCEYPRCREPGHWFVEPFGLMACEQHALDALRNTSDEVTSLDGDLMTFDENGELCLA